MAFKGNLNPSFRVETPMRKDQTAGPLLGLKARLAAAGATAKAAVHRLYPPNAIARSDLMPMPTTMTKETIRTIIDSVEYDPLAGMGCYTKKDLLIDRLLAHCRTTQPVITQNTPPAPILTEVPNVDPKHIDVKKDEMKTNRAA
jgi:hypothetical protein